MAADSDLPVGFRGYDRAATEAALAALEERNAELTRERDDLHEQIGRLHDELEQHRGRSQAVADALVTAQIAAGDLRAVAEAEIQRLHREVAEDRERLVEEGATIRTQARQEATEIIREARIRADRLVEEVVGALEDYQRETDEFVSGTRERLVSLVRNLLGRMPGSAPDYVFEPDVDAEPDAPAAAVA
jgi:cell division septum initiation protein DivIVA